MNRTGRLLALFAMTAVAGTLMAADRPATKDLLQQADAAASAGKLEQAESIVCTASAQDQKNKELQASCAHYRQLAQAQRDADHSRVNKGAVDFAMKNLDAAEAEFRAVQSPSFANLKNNWLDKIAQARAQSAQEQQKKDQERQQADAANRKRAADADAAMQANLDRGIAAYDKNDFAEARKILSTITGSNQERAQKYLANIDQYTKAMKDAAAYEKSEQYKQALAWYQRAAAIKSNGPSNPKQKVESLQQIVAQSEGTQKPDAVPPSPAPDQALVTALQAYYQGDYASAETQLASYTGSSEKLNALAHFYLGASKLSRYYLTPDEARKPELMQAAVAEFHLAKQTPDFAPPKTSISPRVMEVYDSSVH